MYLIFLKTECQFSRVSKLRKANIVFVNTVHLSISVSVLLSVCLHVSTEIPQEEFS